MFPYEPADLEAVQKAVGHMPASEKIDQLAEFYKVMADPTRLKLLIALEHGELCASDLANVAGMSRSAVSHQLKALSQAHLVQKRKEGKSVLYALDDDHIYQVLNVAFEHIQEEHAE